VRFENGAALQLGEVIADDVLSIDLTEPESAVRKVAVVVEKASIDAGRPFDDPRRWLGRISGRTRKSGGPSRKEPPTTRQRTSTPALRLSSSEMSACTPSVHGGPVPPTAGRCQGLGPAHKRLEHVDWRRAHCMKQVSDANVDSSRA
jgi:hypothetical protein